MRPSLMSIVAGVVGMASVGGSFARDARPSATQPKPSWIVENARWPVPDAVLRSGTLSFTGHATLGTFVGTTTNVTGALTGSDDVTNARGWVEATVATLSTANDHRDRDMRASMEVDRFPTMRFELVNVMLMSTEAPPDTVHIMLHGRLTIHGAVRNVALPATLVVAGKVMDVAGEFPLDLADYHIGGLTKFLGTLRMQRNIEVRLRLRFEAKPHATTGELER